GYVYVDIADRDIGSYVDEAKKIVSEKVKTPAGYSLTFSGQYENMIRVKERLKIIIPLTLFLIALLLYMNSDNCAKFHVANRRNRAFLANRINHPDS
ncbi:MAG: efflux RND transporter permease subunit, partial [Burkholderiales bacterium]|nr:efflux RND transporter permease subunit [Burkholderiales bacterium]